MPENRYLCGTCGIEVVGSAQCNHVFFTNGWHISNKAWNDFLMRGEIHPEYEEEILKVEFHVALTTTTEYAEED